MAPIPAPVPSLTTVHPAFSLPPSTAVATPSRRPPTAPSAPKPVVVLQPGQNRRVRFSRSERAHRFIQTAPLSSPPFPLTTETPRRKKNPSQREEYPHAVDDCDEAQNSGETRINDDLVSADVITAPIDSSLRVNTKISKPLVSAPILQPVDAAKDTLAVKSTKAVKNSTTVKKTRAVRKTKAVKIADDVKRLRSARIPEVVTTQEGISTQTALDAKGRENRLNEIQNGRKNQKEAADKVFLNQQLEKRQKEILAKKKKLASKSKLRKRVRRIPSAVRMNKSASLKDTFQAYMNEISREELLDQGTVINLAAQIKTGILVEETQRSMESKLGRRPSIPELAKMLNIDVAEVQKRRMAGTAAKNTLVAANLRLVTSIARKVASAKGDYSAGIAMDDMIQEGSVGLIRAAEKFDADRGYKFSTYATWWVRAFVLRSITTQSRSIKVPSTIVDEYAKIRKEYTALRERGIFQPSDDQVAAPLGITAAKLRFVVNVVTRVPTSLDIKLDPERDSSNSRSLGEMIAGDDNIEERLVEEMQRNELDTALQCCLRPLERAVVRLRFGLDDGQPRTLKETGILLGLSKERIRQLVYKALPKMKTPEIERMLLDAMSR